MGGRKGICACAKVGMKAKGKPPRSGYLLELFACVADMSSRPEPQLPVNNNQAFVSVVRTRLNSHSLGVSSSLLIYQFITLQLYFTFTFVEKFLLWNWKDCIDAIFIPTCTVGPKSQFFSTICIFNTRQLAVTPFKF